VSDALRPYQLDTIRRLLARDSSPLHAGRGLLADQPGLGKTRQLLEVHTRWAAAQPDGGGLAVVAPKSAKAVWAAEIVKWGFDLDVSVLTGSKSWRFPRPGECLILNYANLPWMPSQVRDAREAGKRHGPAIEPCEWPVHLVLDECQALRKRKSLQHLRVRALGKKCAKVTGSTGTPVGGEPFDLYGMLLALGCCPWGWFEFLRLFSAYELPHGGHDFRRNDRGEIIVSPRVRADLDQVMVRHLRSEVAADLPPKLYRLVNVDHKRATTAELDRLGAICAPYFDSDELPPFTEFAHVRKLIAEERIPLIAPAQQAREERGEVGLITSAHRAPVEFAGSRAGWGMIHGDVPEHDRERLVREFEAGQLRGLAIVLKSGATALNLPSADYALFVDRSWDPDENEQFEDRANRMNRTKGPIDVEIWTSKHPVSQHLVRILAVKRALARAVLGE